MSESQTPDLGRIINLIMENPRLIEEISSLAKGDATPRKVEDVSAPQPPQEVREVAASAPQTPRRSRRGELLSLLKPYLSERRASAIDSMISVTDVLKMMKRGE
jgi:hypothetical protein